jgi:hypothetical protein
MDLPADTSLPFFTYGLFRPGQIGFKDLRACIAGYEEGWLVPGLLLGRDGLPVLLEPMREHDRVEGTRLDFHPSHQEHAYRSIVGIEPEKLYRWGVIEARKGDTHRSVNVLLGRKGNRGSHELENGIWDGREEPLFSVALEVVEETLASNEEFDWGLKPLFRLQMAYMLLWSAIERFSAFKYHLGERVTIKVFRLADDPVFASALSALAPERRRVYRSDNPEKAEVLVANNPNKALAYYYQVRSNITHRGKASYNDHDTLVKSLKELLAIFRRLLDAEFRID